MKLDPHKLKFATEVDIETLIAPEERPRFRAAISDKISQKRLLTRNSLVLALLLIDFFGSLILAGLTALQYPGLSGMGENWITYAGFALLGATLVCTATAFGRNYAFAALLSPVRRIGNFAMSWTIAVAILISSIFILKYGTYVSRVWITSWVISGLPLFLSWRLLFGGLVRKFNEDGHFNKTAVLIGGGENAEHVVSIIEASSDNGVNLVGIFDDRDDARVPPSAKGLQKLGQVDDLISFVRQTPVDLLLLTLPISAEKRLSEIFSRVDALPLDIRLAAQDQKLRYRPRAYSFIGNLPCLDLADKPLGEWGPLLKGTMDRVLAALFLILFSPLLALIALAVRMDSKGPVLFKQKRYGFNNELIEVYKFRSMFTEKTDANAATLVTKGDSRVTRVGRFIRKTTLDELPQLFNVLKGELSLVGPRPHATQAKAAGDLYEDVVGRYFARHKVKPGLTGWAQINGWRGETDTAEKIQHRVEHDLYYIENWSLTFDLYILARTPFALLKTENAY